jgi:hypothetical protein
MSKQRKFALIGLAILTIVFVSAAAFAFFGGSLSGRDDHVIEPLPLGEVPEALRISVTEPGFVSISGKQLDEIFLPIETISPDTLNISRDGEPVPFYVDGEGKNKTLYFYAQVITDSLEAPAVYWLAPGPGLSMDVRDAAPSGPLTDEGILSRHWEKNDIFLAQATGEDVWFGELLFAPSSLDVPLENVRSSGGSGELTIRIWSNNQAATDPDHHVILALNGAPLMEHYWDGIKQETITVELPEGLLQEEGNTLTLTAPGDTGAAGEALYIDWIKLKFEGSLQVQDGALVFESDGTNIKAEGAEGDTLLFDITDRGGPVALIGADNLGGEVHFSGNGEDSTFLILNQDGVVQPTISVVPQRQPLTAPGRGADYIAIVADVDGFDEALKPLLDYRQQQGLKVESIPASQVFDEFGHGRATPRSIRDFIRHATRHWDPAPRFALLVGDASYDLNNYTGGKNSNLLPTYLVYTEHAGYVASDTWFTLTEEDSLAPVIALGRLPAQSDEQLSTMVNKTITYENSAEAEWLERALLVADDEADFDQASDNLAENLHDTGFMAQKLYMTENENIHDAIVSALNQGVGIINYVGHGSVEVWGDERVFQAQDAETLINGERLPIFTTFTCLNGYFNHPDVDALAETLIWAKDGGVVASIAPSGRSLTSQQLPLADVFYERLLSGEAETLGEALQMAKKAGSDNDFLSDVIHTFNLLGDPALRFHLPDGAAG